MLSCRRDSNLRETRLETSREDNVELSDRILPMHSKVKTRKSGEQRRFTVISSDAEAEIEENPEPYAKPKRKVKKGRSKVAKENGKKMADKTPQEQRIIREKNREYKRWERARKSANRAETQSVRSAIQSTRRREQKIRRRIASLQNKLSDQCKLTNKWKIRYYRLKRTTEDSTTLTPEKMVEKTLKEGTQAVKNRLLYCESFMLQLAQRKAQMSSAREKSVFAQVVSGRVLKKYKLMRRASNLVSTYLQRRHLSSTTISLSSSRKKKTALHSTLSESVAQFFEKDENSASAPGIKDCITRNGKTFRKRFLSNSMDDLYKKYCAESSVKMSRSTFYRLKPFYVVKRLVSSRDTCLCKTHANVDFLLQKLEYLKIIPTKSTRDFTASMCCDPFEKKCMYRECSICNDRKVAVPDDSNPSWYYQWEASKLDRLGAKGLMYHVKIMSKKKISCTVADVVTALNSRISVYLKHVYDTGHQYKAFEKIRQNLGANEIMVVIDFSENYCAKYASEIQSVHFGASKKQISLHTGAFFYQDKSKGEVKCVSFGTVSECLRHDASSIWAHLKPILNLMKSVVPELHTIHFQSDGPSTQYKNKTNFFLFLHHCRELGLKTATWNFSTPGHGKSCADGSGGTIKNTCDRSVAQGTDVISAEDMIKVVSLKEEAKIKMYLVVEDDMTKIDRLIPQGLKAIPKTQQIFQLVWSRESNDIVYMNHLSCTVCMPPLPCKHYALSPSSSKFPFATLEQASAVLPDALRPPSIRKKRAAGVKKNTKKITERVQPQVEKRVTRSSKRTCQ